MGKARFVALLLVSLGAAGFTNAQKAPSEVERHVAELLGQFEEIAMCHHAIKAAHQDGIFLNQNPYYRYVLNSPQRGHDSNVYPIPERCKSLETSLVLGYTQMSADAKTLQDKTLHDAIGMSISEVSADAQFMTVVINKIQLEGDQAVFWENRDKDIPQ